MILTAFVFLIILSVLVLIHELGHFLVAKYFGIKVEEFGFGLPPRMFGKKIGETIYSINWLPIGGFVKLYGEDEAGAGRIQNSEFKIQNKKHLERAFFSKNPWQKASVVVAGVIMNTVLACVIFYIYLFSVGYTVEIPLLGNHQFSFVQQQTIEGVIIDKVSKNSPAEKAGIVAPARIVAVNNKSITDIQGFLAIINDNKGKEIELSLEDAKINKTSTVRLTPRTNPPKDEGSIGIRFFPVRIAKLTYETQAQKLFSGIIHPFNLMSYNIDILKTLVVASVEKKTAAPLSGAVSGPVGIYSVVGSIIDIENMRERLLQILNLSGLLSISLAFFNILPIPALDGGRLFFILIEGFSGRKVPEKFETMVHTVGMAILLALLLLITFQDISRFFVK